MIFGDPLASTGGWRPQPRGGLRLLTGAPAPAGPCSRIPIIGLLPESPCMTGDDPETQPLLPAFPPQSSVETTAGRGDAPQTRPAESVPPTRRIGGYTIVKTLGRGGLGVVYLAR